jgi:hypothetical protein
MKILLRVFNVKERRDVFSPAVGNERLHETTYNGVKGSKLYNIKYSSCQEYQHGKELIPTVGTTQCVQNTLTYKLHNEELHNVYSSPNIVRQISQGE